MSLKYLFRKCTAFGYAVGESHVLPLRSSLWAGPVRSLWELQEYSYSTSPSLHHPHPGLELRTPLHRESHFHLKSMFFFFPGFYFSNLFLSYYLCSALQFCPFLFALLPTLSWYSWITCLSREHPDLIHSCILTWWWIFDFLWLSLAENSESGDSLSVIICLTKTPFPKSVFSRAF